MRIMFLLIMLFATLQSCSYRWVRQENYQGQTYWERQYKNQEKVDTHLKNKYLEKEQESVRMSFEQGYREETYLKYAGSITSDTIHKTIFVQFDSLRIYFNCPVDSFTSIFTSGLVYSQLLYCKMNTKCQPIPEMFQTKATLWGWSGYTIQVDKFEEVKYLKIKPTQRRFLFLANPCKFRFNGANDVFILELTNDKANRKTDMNTFINGARVTFLKMAWIMI